jgi:type I restriction enzyme S subunit
MQPNGAEIKGTNEIPENWTIVKLNANQLFTYQNGLWKGKKEPLKKVNVLRNTNFTNEGKLNYDDVTDIKVRESLVRLWLIPSP